MQTRKKIYDKTLFELHEILFSLIVLKKNQIRYQAKLNVFTNTRLGSIKKKIKRNHIANISWDIN